jgi:hypothetical protein
VGGDLCFFGGPNPVNMEKAHGDTSVIWSVLGLPSKSSSSTTSTTSPPPLAIVSSGSAGDVKTWTCNQSLMKLNCTSTHFVSTQAIITMDYFESNPNLVVCASLDKQLSAFYVQD